MTKLEIMEVLNRESTEILINIEVEKLTAEIIKLKETVKMQKKIRDINSKPDWSERDKEFYAVMLECQYLGKVVEYLGNELTRTQGKPTLKQREDAIRGETQRLIKRWRGLEQKGRSLIHRSNIS